MKLSELIKTEDIKIPETDLVITIKTELSWVDELGLGEIKNEVDRGKFLLESVIVNWNLKDDKGDDIPVSKDVLGSLPAKIIYPLSERITELIKSKQVKKKTSL